MNFILRRTALAIAAAVYSFSAFAVVNDITLKNVTPKAGELDTELRGLDQIVLTFSSEISAGNDAAAILETPEGQILSCPIEVNQYMKNTVILNYPITQYYTGTYMLTIRKWSVGDDEWHEDYQLGHSNPEIKVEWIVNDGLTPGVDFTLAPISISPADESSWSFPARPLSVLQITMPGEAVLNPDAEAAISNIEARYFRRLTFVASRKGSNTVYTAEISPAPYVGSGNYLLSIPGGCFGDEEYIATGGKNGRANAPVNYIYSVTSSDEESTGDEEYASWIELGNVEIASEGNDYTVSWDWGGRPVADPDALADCKVLDLKGFPMEGIVFSFIDEGDPASGVRFSAELQSDARYTLLLPQAICHDALYAEAPMLQGKANPEYALRFTPADTAGTPDTPDTPGSVGIIGTDAPSLRTVYTLQGIRLYQDATEEQIKALSPGVYIIGGKKVSVK